MMIASITDCEVLVAGEQTHKNIREREETLLVLALSLLTVHWDLNLQQPIDHIELSQFQGCFLLELP